MNFKNVVTSIFMEHSQQLIRDPVFLLRKLVSYSDKSETKINLLERINGKALISSSHGDQSISNSASASARRK